ncbi:gliding motility protein GldM [Ferruginibacter yonginensis]|uniref:Gliding motility protein GldM n=1 Tax=Ferruginibacter yonginensis TaxID=1310416 RepID=A0ABV8QQD5_9BACT
MALPKEPRQKMINIMYLVLTALLALNVSSEILNAFKVVDKSLQTSNSNLTSANETLYKSLQAKVADPVTAEKATIWNGKAEQAKKLSADLSSYIESIKKQLKEEAGLKMVTNEQGQQEEQFKEDDLEAATRLFGNGPGGKNLGVELENKLKAYKAAMLAIDPEINTAFATTLAVDGAPAKGQDGKVKSFTDAYFHMTPTVAGLTLLSKFQNNVKNAENQVVTYCHSKVGEVKVKFDKTGVLIGQSSNYVMPGQEIEVTAGIGAYSSAAVPQISIGGSSVPVVDGKGTYKITASGGGARTIPVTIRYKDQDGNEKTETKNVEYVVGTPGGAAVMLDKMNVFYMGVDNPVTIGSPTGWDKTTVSMSGGTITGSGSNRVVRVSAIGPASITVNADGKPSQFSFRVKRIPDPIFKVGTGKARVPAVEFKNQQFCRADLENFDFDLKFNVVSATVYFSGANFPNPAVGSINGNSLASVAQYMAKAGPGTSVTFVNIKVQGPDGVRSIDERSITLY